MAVKRTAIPSGSRTGSKDEHPQGPKNALALRCSDSGMQTPPCLSFAQGVVVERKCSVDGDFSPEMPSLEPPGGSFLRQRRVRWGEPLCIQNRPSKRHSELLRRSPHSFCAWSNQLPTQNAPGVPTVAQRVMNRLVSMTMQTRSLALLSGLRIQHCYSLSCGSSLDLAFLQLSYRLAAAALIGPLAWELPCAAGVALKSEIIKILK